MNYKEKKPVFNKLGENYYEDENSNFAMLYLSKFT